ncbi:MAG: hypothetical protein CMI18_02825 [Opitutaceae bacterium]|nr:hypothetical protein [Opitutaceae bacterium]
MLCEIVNTAVWENPPAPNSLGELLQFDEQDFIADLNEGPNLFHSQFSSSEPALPQALSHLTENELERAHSFKHEAAKAQFVDAHGILQRVLKPTLKEAY